MIDKVAAALRGGLQTPAHVFDADAVARAREALAARLGTPVVVSIKANPDPALFARIGARFVDGVEVASLGELALVADATVPRYVTTPALTETLLDTAIAARATVMLDSLAQVAMVAARATRPRVGLRINAASLTQARTAAGQDHFGLAIGDAERACETLRVSGIGVAGLLVHAGSNSFDATGVAVAAAMPALVRALNVRLEAPLGFVNLGGGFGTNWASSPALDPYVEALGALRPLVTVMHEAGRAVFAAAGAFVARVQAVKRIEDRGYVVCDGGMAQAFLLAQTERVMKRPATPRVVRLGRPADATEFADITEFRIVGNSCNRADVIGRLPVSELPAPGDCLVFEQMGAYHTYTPTGFLNLGPSERVVL